jgi:hypothetical protein
MERSRRQIRDGETPDLIDSTEGKLEWIPDKKLLDLNLWKNDHIFLLWINDGKLFILAAKLWADLVINALTIHTQAMPPFGLRAPRRDAASTARLRQRILFLPLIVHGLPL